MNRLPTIQVGVGTLRYLFLPRNLSPKERLARMTAARGHRWRWIPLQNRWVMLSGVPKGLGAAGDGLVTPPDLTNSDLQAAGDALANALATQGCQPQSLPVVRAFQQAWVNAGGQLPSDTGGRSPIDGYYGANTAAALGVLHSDAPDGCVGPASGSGGLQVPSTTVTPGPTAAGTGPTAIFASMMSSPAQHPWMWLLVGTGAVLLYQGAGKSYKRSSSHSRRRPTKRRRRGRRR